MNPIGLNTILGEQDYSIRETQSKIILQSKSVGGYIVPVLGVTFGLLLTYFGFYTEERILLLGIVLFAIPLIYNRWSFPKKITVDKNDNSVTASFGLTPKLHYRIQDIDSVIVDEAVLSSDTSPFKAGNQDFIYSFYFKVGSERKKLLSLSYRRDSSEKAKIVFDYFSSSLGLEKSLNVQQV